MKLRKHKKTTPQVVSLHSPSAIHHSPASCITAIEPRSAAARAGLQVGDCLLRINGQPVRDVIDVQIYAAEPELTFLIARDGVRRELTTARRYGQPLGLAFAESLFDAPIRPCRNACEFCFVTQMPRGMRASLYLKDDDYRLSFLNGAYITLTNLSEADWERIATQYLSPLYVSVHATAPEIRVQLMRNPHAGPILAQLQRLTALHIEVHTQAVLVPGCNDGAHLDRTIADLAALYPGVADLTVVPVGLTRECAATLRPYTDAEAVAVLTQVRAWQARCRAELGCAFVYASDEWYLRAAAPIPALAEYDEKLTALSENGVGMVRLFLDSWKALQAVLMRLDGTAQTWITGTLFAPTLRAHAAAFTTLTGIAVTVLPVPNRTFGTTVTVAGLLTVTDVLAALQEHSAQGTLVLPGEMFRGPAGCALDDQFPAAIAAATGQPVAVITGAEGRWHVAEIKN